MALRLLLVLTLSLTFPGMFLHHIGKDCHGVDKCAVCQQAQGTPAEGAPPCPDATPDPVYRECAFRQVAHPHIRDFASEASPRAPPASCV